eukprot:scaffold37232_cov19-Tisochrysis_lutea.AAC.1
MTRSTTFQAPTAARASHTQHARSATTVGMPHTLSMRYWQPLVGMPPTLSVRHWQPLYSAHARFRKAAGADNDGRATGLLKKIFAELKRFRYRCAQDATVVGTCAAAAPHPSLKASLACFSLSSYCLENLGTGLFH